MILTFSITTCRLTPATTPYLLFLFAITGTYLCKMVRVLLKPLNGTLNWQSTQQHRSCILSRIGPHSTSQKQSLMPQTQPKSIFTTSLMLPPLMPFYAVNFNLTQLPHFRNDLLMPSHQPSEALKMHSEKESPRHTQSSLQVRPVTLQRKRPKISLN